MNKVHSAIYQGFVAHQRKIPVEYYFKYSIFMMLLDLDEIPELFDQYWFWSTRKANICFFNAGDHIKNYSKNNNNLKQNLIELVKAEKNITLSGPIRLLTHLRYWGYCFNPVSFYYCYDSSGQNIEAIVAEVNNTPWNEQYFYIMLSDESQNIAQRDNNKHQRFFFRKNFHVSPLMDMDFDYEWYFTNPTEKLLVHMKNLKENQEHFSASLFLKRQEINSRSLSQILIQHPFMTAKVISGIYWRTLLARLKGAKFYGHP